MWASFPFGSEGGVWDLIEVVPDHCLSIYFATKLDRLSQCISHPSKRK